MHSQGVRHIRKAAKPPSCPTNFIGSGVGGGASTPQLPCLRLKSYFAAPAATFFACGSKEGKVPLGFEWMRFHGVRRSSQTLYTPNPKGYGSSAQGFPCVRRSGNRTVPAPIRLSPCSMQSAFGSMEQGACCCASFVSAPYLLSHILLSQR